jgi:hypothetical protein
VPLIDQGNNVLLTANTVIIGVILGSAQDHLARCPLIGDPERNLPPRRCIPATRTPEPRVQGHGRHGGDQWPQDDLGVRR